MSSSAQTRAVRTYRRRLADKGLVRFEIVAREDDRELIRKLARTLCEETATAESLRESVSRTLGGSEGKGGILAALRRSPLVASDLNLSRERLAGREVDL